MDEHTIIEHAGQFNEAVSALIEMEGMKALNQERQINNQAPAYNQHDFEKVLESHGLGHNGCVLKMQRFH